MKFTRETRFIDFVPCCLLAPWRWRARYIPFSCNVFCLPGSRRTAKILKGARSDSGRSSVWVIPPGTTRPAMRRPRASLEFASLRCQGRIVCMRYFGDCFVSANGWLDGICFVWRVFDGKCWQKWSFRLYDCYFWNAGIYSWYLMIIEHIFDRPQL